MYLQPVVLLGTCRGSTQTQQSLHLDQDHGEICIVSYLGYAGFTEVSVQP